MKKQNKYSQCGKKREKLFSNICIAPSFIGSLFFFFVPFGIIVYYSLVNNPIMREFVGIDNFKLIVQNPAFKTAIKNTVSFSVIAVPLAVVLSLGLALLLDAKIPGKSVFRTFFLCPLMVPTASVVLVWQVIFHNYGTVNEFMSVFGFEGVDWLKSPYSHIVIICMFLWKNLGYNMVLFMSGLSAIPKDIVEVAELEGAGRFYKFVNIKLRYLSPTIFFVLIISLINSFKIFREVYLLSGDYPYGKMYLLQHFMNNTFKSLDYQKLSASAILLAIVMIVIIGILFIAEKHFGKDVEE